jgi:hypothetical protein
MFCFFYT